MSESDKEVDTLSGVETTGHVWDGIKESDIHAIVEQSHVQEKAA